MDDSTIHEEMNSGLYPTAKLIQQLIKVYTPAAEAEKAGNPIVFAKPSQVVDKGDQKVVTVYPNGFSEKLMLPGVSVETYLLPGKEFSQGTELLRAREEQDGKVALVLGAGNQSSIPFMDAFYKLYNENQVVIVKHNPVAEWLYPMVERVMTPFIELDYFHHVRGGVEEGKLLCELCDNVHITGSDKTHDAIVWGNNDKTGEPQFKKEITSELGSVSPFIIVPGDWSAKEITYVAQHVAGAIVNNNSYNCNAAKLLVLQSNWKHKEAFINEIASILQNCNPKYAYYPGSKNRYDEFVKRYPNSEKIGHTTEENRLPWLLIRDIPRQKGEYALCNEPFCPVISETSVEAEDIPSFLDRAVKFCNEDVWGNLSMSVFIDPKTETTYKTEFEKAIDDLKYGGIAVNCWAGVNYALSSPVWGAYPGNDIKDIQSGKGFVHNSFLIDNPEKSVTRAPFSLPLGIKYPYFPSHKNATRMVRSMVQYELSPSWYNFASTMWNASFG